MKKTERNLDLIFDEVEEQFGNLGFEVEVGNFDPDYFVLALTVVEDEKLSYKFSADEIFNWTAKTGSMFSAFLSLLMYQLIYNR